MNVSGSLAVVSPVVWAMFAITVALDVFGQTAFKLGLRHMPAAAEGVVFWKALLGNWLIVVGVAGYAIEACTWMYALGHAPMSVIGPMAALSYVGAVFAGAVLLDERVGRRRSAGAAIVAIGAALLASSTR